jgi:LemA protein
MLGTILLGLAALAALYVIIVYNRLVRQRNLVREGWSGIDVQLRRRADLVPNLVETVKGYAGHERELLEEIAQARSRSIAASGVGDQAQAERRLEGALGRLFAVAEAYPELKADANFRDLQQQLADVEDQLQMARRYYNGTARDLNTSVQSFPNNLVAGPLGFKEEPFFELGDEAARAAPQVRFAH